MNAQLQSIWAKSPQKNKATGETLAAHTANVISRLHDFSKIYPDLHIITGQPEIWQFAFWSCVFHDFGKVATGFQKQLRQQGAVWGQRHEVLSLAFVQWAIPGINDEWLSWINAGIVTHHKNFDQIKSNYPFLGSADPESIELLVKDVPIWVPSKLAEWLASDVPKWQNRWHFAGQILTPEFDCKQDFFESAVERIRRGLLLVAKLRRKMENADPCSVERLSGIALRGIVTLSDHTGSAHIRPKQIDSVEPASFCAVLIPNGSSYPHQIQCASAKGHTILKAPTGSGKTEASLLWLNSEKYYSGNTGRMLYVLPYQASLNAMYLRLSRLFQGNITLQHSRALQSLFKMLLDKGYSPNEAAKVAKQERALARLYHFGVRVLTPYQLLRAAFQLKGFEALLTDCTDAHIIFDEIHAYEPQRLGMLLGLIEFLAKNWRVHFFVMSATLPGLLQKHINKILPDLNEVIAGEEIFKKFIRHKLHTIPETIDSLEIIEKIVDAARQGMAVLVVCNTVKKATEVFHRVKAAQTEAAVSMGLLHGRFNSRDRLRKERELSEVMGTNKRDRNSKSGMILIATQVVEVSLDIDFDILFTELAPLESLVQRFGRINRGRKQTTCPVHVLTEPRDGQFIYEDQIIERVLALLPELDGQLIDESMISNWLDRIYEGKLGEDLEKQMIASKDEFLAVCINQLIALDSNDDLVEKFEAMFDGTEVLPVQFLEEYERLNKQDALLAGDMFVPISYHQLRKLKREGKIEKRDYINIANAAYSSDFGLEL